jgi:hypothetical protein
LTLVDYVVFVLFVVRRPVLVVGHDVAEDREPLDHGLSERGNPGGILAVDLRDALARRTPFHSLLNIRQSLQKTYIILHKLKIIRLPRKLIAQYLTIRNLPHIPPFLLLHPNQNPGVNPLTLNLPKKRVLPPPPLPIHPPQILLTIIPNPPNTLFKLRPVRIPPIYSETLPILIP